MSQHRTHALYDGKPVTVLAGYDRPLRELFLHVTHEAAPAPEADGREEVFLYSSLNEPQRDWTNINTVIDALQELRIEVPQSLVDEIYLDQCFNVGNRFVEHPNASAPGPTPHL